MYSRRFLGAVLLAATLLAVAPVALAFPACDNFGQDWNITLEAFGGTFPGTAIVSGCRDCNASLGCGGAPPLDGAVVIHGTNHLWSLTSYNPVGGSCFSAHWTGNQVAGTNHVNGTVSNDAGPFGSMQMTLHSNCGSATPRAPTDPATHIGTAN